MTEGLVAAIREDGGTFRFGEAVESIARKPGGGFVVSARSGTSWASDLVVSSAGLPATVRLLGALCPTWLRQRAAAAVPAYGASFSVRSRAPLLEHPYVEVPLDARFISGCIQVTNSDPGLAPAGWHYLLAYQRLERAEIGPQVAAAREELSRLFPVGADVFNISIFHDGWPAARLLQSGGPHGVQRLPIAVPEHPGLFMVSHDSQGHGFGAELIGSAALAFEAELSRGVGN